jgi:glycosyltransferase involved in cell wall biosynthesis
MVTIVIPTYNRAELLRESLASALAQEGAEVRVLVSDNASTDGTANVVGSFADPRVTYHRHPHNLGMMGNFRAAIERVDTEYVAVLPDDDLYEPDHVARALAALAAHPRAAYYACPAAYFGDRADGALRPRAIRDVTTGLIVFKPGDVIRFLGQDTPGPFHVVARRAAFHEHLYWGEGHFPPFDVLVLSQLAVQGGFVFANHASTRFRYHANSTTVGAQDKTSGVRFNLMLWFAIRWLCQYFVTNGIASLDDIEQHGLTAADPQHVVPVVLALASFDSPDSHRLVAQRIFRARRDVDGASSRFRLARRADFGVLPVLERISQRRCNWRPPKHAPMPALPRLELPRLDATP